MQAKLLLNKLSKDVADIQNQARVEFEALTSKQLNWKESENVWSIAECLEHLNIYAAYYLPAIEQQISKTTDRKENVNLETKSTWFGKFSINMIDPSNVKKQKTAKHLNPSNSKIEGDVVKRFLENQTKLLRLLGEVQGLNLNKVKIPVEFFKLLKINLGDCFQFLVAHEKRHLIQANKVKNKIP